MKLLINRRRFLFWGLSDRDNGPFQFDNTLYPLDPHHVQEGLVDGLVIMKGSQGISGAIWPMFFTGIYYLVFNGVMTLLLGRLEKKLNYYQ